MAMWLTTYKVTGKGAFPVDMLRYDCSYPTTTEDALAVVENPEDLVERTIELSMRSDRKFDRPCIGRWQSFGWTVGDIRQRHLG